MINKVKKSDIVKLLSFNTYLLMVFSKMEIKQKIKLVVYVVEWNIHPKQLLIQSLNSAVQKNNTNRNSFICN